jgi:hypothetical protein
MITKEQFEELGFKHQEDFDTEQSNLTWYKRAMGLWLIDSVFEKLIVDVVQQNKPMKEEEFADKYKRYIQKWHSRNQVDFNTYDRFYSGQFPYHIVYNEKTNKLAVLYSAHTGARGVIFEGWCKTYEELELLLKMLRVNK